jgi:hypothetical protein
MKHFIEGESRNQSTLFPECLEDYVSEDNLWVAISCSCGNGCLKKSIAV